jgi:hypothetical protein
MQMKKWLIPAVAATCLMPIPALAGHMSYAYMQATHLIDMDADLDPGGKEDGNGFGVKFGFIGGPYFLMDASYEDGDYDGADSTEIRARAGMRHPIVLGGNTKQRLDWYGLLSYEDLEIDGLLDDSGVGGTLALRWAPTDWLEFAAEANGYEYGDVDGHGWTFDIHLNAGPVIGFVFQYRDQNLELDAPGPNPDLDRDTVSAGFRFQFGGSGEER